MGANFAGHHPDIIANPGRKAGIVGRGLNLPEISVLQQPPLQRHGFIRLSLIKAVHEFDPVARGVVIGNRHFRRAFRRKDRRQPPYADILIDAVAAVKRGSVPGKGGHLKHIAHTVFGDHLEAGDLADVGIAVDAMMIVGMQAVDLELTAVLDKGVDFPGLPVVGIEKALVQRLIGNLFRIHTP